MMMPSEMSDVDVLFSQVHVLLCEIDVKLSKCQEVSQSGKSVLPRVGNILAQMQDIVSHHFIETSHTTNLWHCLYLSAKYPIFNQHQLPSRRAQAH